MAVLLFFSLLVVSCLGKYRHLSEEWKEWKQAHGKVYAQQKEENIRFQHFRASAKKVRLLNAASNNTGARYGLNQFSDMSPEEFKNTYLIKKGIQSNGIHPEFERPVRADVPQSIDWRTHKVVTAVKNQEQCGSCWAFSVTEAIESAWMLAKKNYGCRLPTVGTSTNC